MILNIVVWGVLIINAVNWLLSLFASFSSEYVNKIGYSKILFNLWYSWLIAYLMIKLLELM